MMESRQDNIIPGYTGFKPTKPEYPVQVPSALHNGCIPGYGGYINGVRSENLYGKTYGKITFETGQHLNHWGNDLTTKIKYTSSTKEAFQNPTVSFLNQEYKHTDQFTVTRAFNQEYQKEIQVPELNIQSNLTFEQIKQKAYL